MAKSAQEQAAWAQQEQQFRGAEAQIEARWVYTLLPALCLFNTWEALRYERPHWMAFVSALASALSVYPAARAWALTFRYRRETRAAQDSGKADLPTV